MKMKTRIILCLIIITVSFNISSGQKAGSKVTITGKVVDGTEAAVANAFILIDGVPVNTIDNIKPLDVRSISILKGSSAAIYGSRGSNGVIILNLLRGDDK